MASDLLGQRCFPLQHVPHDLAERGNYDQPWMVIFEVLVNLKEAVLKPAFPPSPSTSLPIRSLNDVGDSFLLCGPRTLCLA